VSRNATSRVTLVDHKAFTSVKLSLVLGSSFHHRLSIAMIFSAVVEMLCIDMIKSYEMDVGCNHHGTTSHTCKQDLVRFLFVYLASFYADMTYHLQS